MNTPTGARINALTNEVRSATEGTFGPETLVWVRCGALLDLLDALEERNGAQSVAASASCDGHVPHAINPLAHEQTK